jgi:hypothetical protein
MHDSPQFTPPFFLIATSILNRVEPLAVSLARPLFTGGCHEGDADGSRRADLGSHGEVRASDITAIMHRLSQLGDGHVLDHAVAFD